MSWSLPISHGLATGQNSPVALTLNTTGADFAHVSFSHNAAVQTFSVTDNKGNTWTKRPDYTGNPFCESWDTQGGTFGASHIITVTRVTGSDPIFMTACGACFSGSPASPYDTGNGNGNDITGFTTCNPGPITPAGANELLLAFVGLSSTASAAAIDSGFTILDGNNGGSFGQWFGGNLAYLIYSGTGSITPTWTWTGGSPFTNLIVAYKAPSVSQFSRGYIYG